MATAALHQRSESSESSSSHGSSAYQLILDHVLSYPGSYEIPLRTMYTLNSTPRAQPPHIRSHSPPSDGNSPTKSRHETPITQALTDSLMAQMSQASHQQPSLPPSFITSFVRKCFAPELIHVDFPQALTGLDYLKDLETRRRRVVRNALECLEINRDVLEPATDAFANRYPKAAPWTDAIEKKERRIDALYTSLFIGLRRWILINELSLTPFSRHNCHAMLNTLYPPVVPAQPTKQLTTGILRQQRDGFFKYIQSVEKSGPRILGNLMQQGRAEGEDNGWAAVVRTLGMYLQLANSMIKECVDITGAESLPSPNLDRHSKASTGSSASITADHKPVREPRKVDSGVSFNSQTKTSRSGSFVEPTSPVESVAKELPRPETARPVTAKRDTERPKTPAASVKSVATTRHRATSTSRSGTALEKLARGLRSLGRGRPEVTEMVSTPAVPPLPEKTKTLRKMRSMGTLDFGSSSNNNDTFARQQQRAYEA